MKKQLFSFVVMLALIVFAGTSAWAQGPTANGLTPATPRLAIVGSVSHFLQVETGDNDATYVWTILEMDPAGGLEGTGTSTVNTGGRFVTSAGVVTGASTTSADAYIQWLKAPGTSGNVYAIECTATTSTVGQGTCTTKRRFFMTVFDYDVDIYLSDNAGGKLNLDADLTDCNSWASQILANTIEGTQITNPHFATTHNGNLVTGTPAGIEKTTTTYFTVEITTSGPAVALSTLNRRLKYSMPTATAALSLYQIDNIGSNSRAQFSTISGANLITGAEVLTIATTGMDAGGNDIVFIPAGGSATTSEKFIFEVRTHNNLGAAQMVYNMQLDQTAVALQPSGTLANTDFNDGIKYNAAMSIPDAQTLKDGVSGVRTIQMSPASSVITITD